MRRSCSSGFWRWRRIPPARLALLAENVEGAIATVFRQTAMNRFEHLVHTARREEGELSVERINEAWVESQVEMLGDSVEITEGYRTWWSYVPHFISTPGYVYAYSYGQLLALAVYKQYQEQGEDFVPSYIEMLAAGRIDAARGTRQDRRLRSRRPRVLERWPLDRRRPTRRDRGRGKGSGTVCDIQDRTPTFDVEAVRAKFPGTQARGRGPSRGFRRCSWWHTRYHSRSSMR